MPKFNTKSIRFWQPPKKEYTDKDLAGMLEQVSEYANTYRFPDTIHTCIHVNEDDEHTIVYMGTNLVICTRCLSLLSEFTSTLS